MTKSEYVAKQKIRLKIAEEIIKRLDEHAADTNARYIKEFGREASKDEINRSKLAYLSGMLESEIDWCKRSLDDVKNFGIYPPCVDGKRELV